MPHDMESRVIIMKNVEPERSCIVLEILSNGHEDDYDDEGTSSSGAHSHRQREGFRNEKNVPAIGEKRSERVIYSPIAAKRQTKKQQQLKLLIL